MQAVPQKKLPAPPVPARRKIGNDPAAQLVHAQALVRGFLQRRRYKQETFRLKVVRELAASERVYVDLLAKVVDVFMKPLRRAIDSGKPIISEAEFRDLFVNLEELYALHHTLLVHLEARISRWSLERPLADIFLQAAPAMTPLYVNYANAFERSNQVLQLCAKSSAWKAFLKVRVYVSLFAFVFTSLTRVYALDLRARPGPEGPRLAPDSAHSAPAALRAAVQGAAAVHQGHAPRPARAAAHARGL